MANRGFWVGMAALGALLVFATAGTEPAGAAFPGENGRILYAHENVLGYDGIPDFPYTDEPDIWAMDPDGTAATNLTATPEEAEHAPASSPDGTRVAFVRAGDIWAMGADGSGQTKLTNTPGQAERGPTWSPDGGKIAFSRSEDGTSGVWVLGADGSGQRRLTDGGSPTWSPDGTRLAFVAASAGAATSVTDDIWSVNPDGTGRENLTGPHRRDGFVVASRPSFSPDGEKIAFAAYDDERSRYSGCVQDIFTMDAGGSAWTNLTRVGDTCNEEYPTVYDHPAWSPDGKKIAFVGEVGSYSEVGLMGSDGSNRRYLNPDPTPRDDYGVIARDPDWQPACPCPGVPPPDEDDTADPKITGTRPSPGSEARDRTPTIRAVVRDEASDLTKADITLRVDGKAKRFSYDTETDRLSRATRKLSYGRHTVEVEAIDGAGNTATERWSFRVVKRR